MSSASLGLGTDKVALEPERKVSPPTVITSSAMTDWVNTNSANITGANILFMITLSIKIREQNYKQNRIRDLIQVKRMSKSSDF
jgi:hypothetical protein